MARHRVFIDTKVDPGPLAIEGEEAHHAARVKRLDVGDALEVLDGRGRVGAARVVEITKPRGQWRMDVEVLDVREEPRVRPFVEVLTAPPKGPRVTDMIDGLSQAGAASWSALDTDRSIGEARDSKLERVRRAAEEASKQCGRAWLLEVGAPVRFDDALRAPGAHAVLADASGGPYETSGAERVRILIGPEGGWSERELEKARAAGVRVCRFGPHVMRIETAAIVACAVVVDAENRRALMPGS